MSTTTATITIIIIMTNITYPGTVRDLFRKRAQVTDTEKEAASDIPSPLL